MKAKNKVKQKTSLQNKMILVAGGVLIASIVGILIFFYFNLGNNRDAKAAPTSISGVINSYGRVTGINTNNLRVTFDNLSGNTSDFAIGRKVMLIQMKGASVITTNGATYGNISSYGNAGNYEFATVTDFSIQGSGYRITLSQITRSYSTNSYVQVVSVPQYTDAIVTGNISPRVSWDRTLGRGGIIALEVQNTLELRANINADAAGFKGGTYNASGDGGATNNTTYIHDNSAAPYLGQKGEGIADYESSTRQYGRGHLANGGGGGNTHNAGGAGGGNWTAGGSGGNGWSGSSGGAGGSGIGGSALSYNSISNQIFMGGGGGGGQQNDLHSGAGGNGGGIIIIRAGTITSDCAGTWQISANGSNGGDALGDPGDGAGGGGSGGTILMEVNAFSLSCNLTVSTTGGRGGNVVNTTQHGGGGGGGMGADLFKTAPPSRVVVLNIQGAAGQDCSSGCTSTSQPGSTCSSCPTNTGWSVMGADMTLPIELLSFEGKAENKEVNLFWVTSKEINNDYFAVQRSADGKDFQQIGTIKSRGNSSENVSYTFRDNSPLPGTNYYRLVQTDFNGQSQTFDIITVKSGNYGTNDFVTVSPNPFSDRFSVKINLEQKGKITAQFQNSKGDIIFKKEIEGVAGENEFQFTEGQGLAQGVYVLTIRVPGGKAVHKKVLRE